MNQISTALTHDQILALDPVRRDAAELARGKPVEAAAEAKEAVEPAPVLPQLEPAPQPVAAAPEAPVVAFRNADKRKRTFTLKWPFEVDGQLIESVELRRINGADYRRFTDALTQGIDENTAMLDIMSDLPAGVVDSIDIEDLIELKYVAMDFLPTRLQAQVGFRSVTGAASPQ